MPKLVFYSTSVPITVKLKKDIELIKRILMAKRVEYEEIDLAMDGERREEMIEKSNGIKRLPQLHIDDKYVGDAHFIQELEDYGELDAILKGEVAPPEHQP